MDIDEVIEHFGSSKLLQDALGVTKAAVSQWRASGIPRLRQFQIQALTNGKFCPADRALRSHKLLSKAEE